MIETFNRAAVVTPSNTVDLPGGRSAALWIGGGGTLAVVMQDGSTVTLAAVPAGVTLPLAVKRVNVTGTSATNILALYQV